MAIIRIPKDTSDFVSVSYSEHGVNYTHNFRDKKKLVAELVRLRLAGRVYWVFKHSFDYRSKSYGRWIKRILPDDEVNEYING